MLNQRIKRILAFTMVCALTLMCGAQALADQVYVKGSVAVYDQPNGNKLGTLKSGTKIDVVAEKSGWAMVKKGDATAYMPASGLIRVEDAGNITAYARMATVMYKSFSTGSKKLGTIPEGTSVTVAAKAEDLAYVRCGKYKGYVKASDLTTQAPQKAEAQAEATAPVAYRTVYVAKDGAKVYNAKGKAVGTLAVNTELSLTGEKNGVCRVTSGGKTAYMYKSDLSENKVSTETSQAQTEEKVEEAAQTTVSAFVNKDGAKVYNAGGKVIGTVNVNTAVTVTAVKGNVSRVTNGGKTAYMKKTDLSCDKVEVKQADTAAATVVSATAYVNKDGAKVYNAGGESIGTLKLNAAVTVTAVRDDVCQVTSDGKTAYMKKADLSATKTEAKAEETAVQLTGGSTVTPARGTAVEMDWWTSDIQKIFARGVTAQITDVATGLSWREQRRGGTNHADVQPLTAADTAALKKAYGGAWSWSRRAIFVTINGVNYAASMNGMPHGGGSIADNNFNGHHCIHFTNSRTHGSNKVCSLHQAAIKKAASARL